jgi:hypothetical protein
VPNYSLNPKLLNTLLGNDVIQALQQIQETMLIMYCDGAFHHVPEASQSFDDFLKQSESSESLTPSPKSEVSISLGKHSDIH